MVIYHAQGNLKGLLLCFVNLSWHTAGFVTLLLHERNKPNVMTHKYMISPKARYHIYQQVAVISPPWATHAWTKLYIEIMS